MKNNSLENKNLSLCGWTNEEIISLLTPKKQLNETLTFAGWSPNSLNSALNYSPEIITKKRNNLLTPENNFSYQNKIIDLKNTPNISSITNQNNNFTSLNSSSSSSLNNNNNSNNNSNSSIKNSTNQTIISLISPEKEVEDLSQIFAEHTIKHISPKKPFQPARIYFEETRKKINFAESTNLDDTLPNGWKLYDFQKIAIRRCLTQERSILALDMGLGIF